MQKARRHPQAPTACKRMVSSSISPRCSRYFSPFPHGTRSLSVSQEYLALADGAAGFEGDFSGPHLLRILTQLFLLPVQDSHLLRLAFPRHSSSINNHLVSPTTPVWP